MVDGQGLQRLVQLGSGAWSGQVSGFFEEAPTSQLPIPKPKPHNRANLPGTLPSAPTAYLRGLIDPASTHPGRTRSPETKV